MQSTQLSGEPPAKPFSGKIFQGSAWSARWVNRSPRIDPLDRSMRTTTWLKSSYLKICTIVPVQLPGVSLFYQTPWALPAQPRSGTRAAIDVLTAESLTRGCGKLCWQTLQSLDTSNADMIITVVPTIPDRYGHSPPTRHSQRLMCCRFVAQFAAKWTP